MFIDREPTYPNRFKVVPETGEAYYATLERADKPITVGTPLNAATLNPLFEEVARLRSELDAMKGVPVAGADDPRTPLHPATFDYFLLYETEDETVPMVFNTILNDTEQAEVTAECLHRLEDTRDLQQPRSLLKFALNEYGEWEMTYTDETGSGTTYWPRFYRVYGFKYPKREV